MRTVGWGVLMPVIVCAQMSITATEEVRLGVEPDVLHGSLQFEMDALEASSIQKAFNTLITETKRIDPKAEHCRGGGYRISPRYTYTRQKQEFAGYRGNLAFECEWENASQFDRLNAALDKASASDMRKTQGALEWDSSHAQRETVQDRLRQRMLERVRSAAEAFSQQSAMACEVISVRIDPPFSPMPLRARSMAMMEAAPTESPIQAEEERRLRASVEYRCLSR